VRRVAVAMSGGVDSGVVAALLRKQGFDVIGLTMQLWRLDPDQDTAIASAQGICRALGIPHYVVDYRDFFEQKIVDRFVRAYVSGRTPNPCVQCNRHIKFGRLWKYAVGLGCNYLATGHYARIWRERERYVLARGRDRSKDQSYFLYTLRQDDLSHLLFPLGVWTKTRVRMIAREMGLPCQDRPESQDVCFLSGEHYHQLIYQRAPSAVRPGPIYDREGRCLGQHKGLPFYTIGQRRGLGIAAPRPLYVLEIDSERNALIVGFSEELGRRVLFAKQVSYVMDGGIASGLEVTAQIRYRARPARARAWPLADGRVRLEFEKPLRDITPGQSVVFYRGDRVLGGGIIESSAVS